MKIAILHGINLNMFGRRDPGHYGTATLEDIDNAIRKEAAGLRCVPEFFQSNHEGEFVEKIHSLLDDGSSGVVLNAGAWTHYSYGIADALAMLPIPKVEVHMSNVHAREAFRHFSVLSPVVDGSIAGFGTISYLLGLRAAVELARRARTCPPAGTD